MKVVIPGGGGQVGTILSRALAAQGHDVVILSRGAASGSWTTVQWDGRSMGSWASEIDGAEVVINLAGRSVNCRYNAKNRREIMDSRVVSTRIIGQAISQAKRPPSVWLQASTATIYSHRYDAPNDEFTGMIGGDEPGVPDTWRFSIDVAKAWEAEAMAAQTPATRKVLLRSAMTMSPDRGGIFDVLIGLVKKGLGGKAGDGRQFVSWIHETDFVNAINWLIAHPEIEGPVNLSSPTPLPNSEFMRILRKAAGIPVGLPATRLMLEVGALLMRTETELILKSRRVIPQQLEEGDFQFEFPSWLRAAQDLIKKRELMGR